MFSSPTLTIAPPPLLSLQPPLGRNPRMECSICLDLLRLHDPATTPCGHTFHREPCLRALLQQARPECPLCRAALDPRELPAVSVVLRDALAAAGAAPPARAPLRAVDPALLAALPAPLLGEGSYGRVHYGTYDGTEVAVKVLQLDSRDAAPQVLAGFRREAELFCDLSHPNILHMYGVLEGGGAGGGGGGGGCGAGGRPALSLVMRLADGGSLAEALHGGPLPAAASRRVALGVARALAHLHSRDPPVSHNDLKSGNVLLDGEGNALLADFGVAKAVGGTLRHTHGASARGELGAVGTVAWMAPENGDPEDPFYLKPNADVFSFAMLLFELATGRMPWEGMNMGQINAAVMRGRRPQLPAGVDAGLKSLVEACWAQVPGERPAMAQVVARLVGMEWGRGSGERAEPGAAWVEKLRDARRAAGATAKPPAAATVAPFADFEAPTVLVRRVYGSSAADPNGHPGLPVGIDVFFRGHSASVGANWNECGFCSLEQHVETPPAFFDAEEQVVWLWLLNKERNGTWNNNGTMARVDFKPARPVVTLSSTYTERNCGYFPCFSSVLADTVTVDHFAFDGYFHARSTLVEGKWTTTYMERASPDVAAGLHRTDQARLKAMKRACNIKYMY